MESNINQARQLLEEEIQELHIQIDQLTGKRDIILNVIKIVIITSAVRAGGNYVEIARDLSGTLQTAVEKSLRKLVAMDLVRIDGNEYYINQQKM